MAAVAVTDPECPMMCDRSGDRSMLLLLQPKSKKSLTRVPPVETCIRGVDPLDRTWRRRALPFIP